MKEFIGTKGKWRVIDGWDKAGNGKYFPSVVLFGPDDDGSLGRNRIVINVSHDQKIESLMANAKLIAAAPEMLEMLQKIKEINNLHNFNGHLINKQIEELLTKILD